MVQLEKDLNSCNDSIEPVSVVYQRDDIVGEGGSTFMQMIVHVFSYLNVLLHLKV